MGVLGQTATQNVSVATLPNQLYSPRNAQGAVIAAKFMILQFSGQLQGTDTLTVELNTGSQSRFDNTSGSSYWSLPIKGNSTRINLQGASNIRITSVAYSTNFDLLSTAGWPADPLGAADARGWSNKASGDSGPAWEPVHSGTTLQKNVASRVGIFLYVSELNGVREPRFCTAALIGSRQILTAAHCIWSAGFIEADSGAFCLNYEEPAVGAGAGAVIPELKFYKVRRLIKTGFRAQNQRVISLCNQVSVLAPNPAEDPLLLPWLDYAVIELMEDVPGVQPLTLETAPLADGSEVFIIHHPGGRPKKVSRRLTAPNNPAHDCLKIATSNSTIAANFMFYDCDCDKGSSGSPVFNSNGKIVGIATEIYADNPTNPNPALQFIPNKGPHAPAIARHFQEPNFDQAISARFAVVVDTSGSMGMLGDSGVSKMAEAREAVTALVSLLRTSAPPAPATLHKLTLIEFNTNFAVELALRDFDAGVLNDLRSAPDPDINSLREGGWTAIGSGLREAHNQISAGNPPPSQVKAILLMTDGVQTETPWAQDVVATFGPDVRVDIVGFGRAELDGALLSKLAREHCGTYTHASGGLALKKYFAAIYSNVFETGMAFDPPDEFAAGVSQLDPIPLKIFGESAVTVLLGWERFDADLELSLRRPDNTLITAATPDVRSLTGNTWTHLRVELPADGSQNGDWEVLVERKATQPLRLWGHSSAVKCVTFDWEGTHALSGDQTGAILYWSLETGKPRRRLRYPGDAAPVIGVAIWQDNDTAITALQDGRILIWSLATAELVRQFQAANALLSSLAVNFELGWIAVGNLNGGVQLWDLNGNLLNEYLTEVSVSVLAATRYHPQLLVGLTELAENNVLLVELESGAVLNQYTVDGTVRALALSSQEDFFAVGYEQIAEVRELNSGTTVMQVSDGFVVSSVAFCLNDQALLVGSLAADLPSLPGTLTIWDLAGSLRFNLKAHTNSILATSSSIDGFSGLSASADTTLMLWDLTSGQPKRGALDVVEPIFVSALVSADVFLIPRTLDARTTYYTGDVLNPQVVLRNINGSHVPASIELEIEAPANSIGNILAERGLLSQPESGAIRYDGETLPPVIATLSQYQEESLTPLVDVVRHANIPLYDDGDHHDGAMEPDGIFANLIHDVTLHEGNYTFRARAIFGLNGEGTRETVWSIYVGLGIESSKTRATTTKTILATQPDGSQIIALRFIPTDAHGNLLGPGRAKLMTVAASGSSALYGELRDLGQGAYEQQLSWNPQSGEPPALNISQPDRPAITIFSPDDEGGINPDRKPSERRLSGWWIALAVTVLLALLRRLFKRRQNRSSR